MEQRIRKVNNELPFFKEWLLANRNEEELKSFSNLLLKIRLDNEFPAGYLNFSELLTYLDGKKVYAKTKVAIFLLWEMYIRNNLEQVTLREIGDFRQQALAMIQTGLLIGNQRARIEETVLAIMDLADKAGVDNDFSKGINW